MTIEDGTTEMMRIPAEIWRRTPKKVQKLIVTDKDKIITDVTLDPRWETADTDITNNHYPRKIIESRIESYKRQSSSAKVRRDIMNDIKTELKTDEDNDDEENDD